MKREIDQDDILDLINCANSYGHYNQVCMEALVQWASPVTPDDIERYARSVQNKPGYSIEDYNEIKARLTEIIEWYETVTSQGRPTQEGKS